MNEASSEVPGTGNDRIRPASENVPESKSLQAKFCV